MRVKKRLFTLLEILIVLFILSLGAILTGVKVNDLYREQQFLSESHQVLNQLKMAQDLMLIMNADVEVKFAYDSQTKQLICWLEIEKPLPDNWKRLVERKLILPSISSYRWNKKEENTLTLSFIWGQMSQGTLLLLRGTKEEFKIELLGYPAPLGHTSALHQENLPLQKTHSLYPAEIYEALYKKKNES